MAYPPTRIRLGPRLTPVVTWLIGIHVATFLLFAFSGRDAQIALARWLILTPAALLHGEVWKLATTVFFNPNPLGFFLDLLVLWMFVTTLESAWGRKRFLTFFALTSLVGNLAAALFGLLVGPGTPIAGMGPFIYGAIAAFGVEWAEQPVQFFGVIPMKGKTLAIGVTIILFLQVLLNREWVFGVGYFAAIIAAIGYSGSPRLWILRFRRARLKKRYTVLRGGNGGHRWLN